MRRIILTTLFILTFVSNVWAVAGSWSTWTYDSVSPASTIRTMSITMTGGTGVDAGTVPNLSFDATTLDFIKGGWWLIGVETNPGSTAPTASYDVVVNDVHGMDIMGGTLMNRSATLTENAKPEWYQTSAGFVPFDGTAITVVVTNNAAESSTVVFKFWLSK